MVKNIALLKGGFSNEAEISRKTAISVENTLKLIGYNVFSVEVNNNFPKWLIENKNKIDVVFNALHGSWGEDGKVQGLLEYIGIPYTHSGVTASAIGMNKEHAKKIFFNSGIKAPNSILFDPNSIEELEDFKKPYVIKPVSGGSSLGIQIVEKNTTLKEFINEIKDEEFIVEEYIPGKDITVALIDGKSIGILEVRSKQNFYNYSAKYNKHSKTEYIQANYLPSNIKEKLLRNSIKANNILKCRGVTRVDFRLNLELGLDGVFLLEINTQPGLTENSLVPKIAKLAGISFEDLITLIVNDAGVNK